MATISLYLRTVEHSPSIGIINLRFTHARKSSYISLRVRVKKQDFQSHEFPYIKKNAAHSARLNALLRNELNKAQDIIFDYQMKRETLTFKAFKSQYLPKKDVPFKDYAITYFRKRMDSGAITHSTYHTYEAGIKCFTLFAKDPMIGQIDQHKIAGYKEMLITTKSNSTASVYIKAVFMAYEDALKNKYRNRDAFAGINLIPNKRQFQKGKTPLTLEELQRLNQDYLNYKNHRSLGNYPQHYFVVLQKFLFSCFTGLRYSDVNSLQFKHLKKMDQEGDNWTIEKVIVKTKKLASIPLLPQALDLIYWNTGHNPDTFVFEPRTICHSNNLLKGIDKIANINKAMTTHTGRHTFASLSITLGMRREVIQEILGHSAERMTERYATINIQLMKEDLDINWKSL